MLFLLSTPGPGRIELWLAGAKDDGAAELWKELNQESFEQIARETGLPGSIGGTANRATEKRMSETSFEVTGEQTVLVGMQTSKEGSENIMAGVLSGTEANSSVTSTPVPVSLRPPMPSSDYTESAEWVERNRGNDFTTLPAGTRCLLWKKEWRPLQDSSEGKRSESTSEAPFMMWTFFLTFTPSESTAAATGAAQEPTSDGTR